MTKLRLSVAIGDYDRMRPLIDGTVQIDAVDPQFMLLEPEEIFFRAIRHADFDICELSLSSYSVKLAAGTSSYIAVPIFPSRAFRHTAVYVRKDRAISHPTDLKGKRIGVPEYQLTANVWVRLLLKQEYGVDPTDIPWVRRGYEQSGRIEKASLNLSEGIRVEEAPGDKTISGMLAAGELDAVIGPREPSCFCAGNPLVGYLFDDPQRSAQAWFRKRRIFPIMHVLGVRRALAEAHPWLPGAVVKAFEKSKSVALTRLGDTSSTKVTLPFVEEHLAAARTLMGATSGPMDLPRTDTCSRRF